RTVRDSWVRLHHVPEPLESEADASLHRAERLLDLIGDLRLGEPRVVRELDDLALGVRQSPQRVPDRPAVLRALGRVSPPAPGNRPNRFRTVPRSAARSAASPAGSAGAVATASSSGATNVSVRRRV